MIKLFEIIRNFLVVPQKASMSEKELQLRAEIKRLLKEAAALSQSVILPIFSILFCIESSPLYRTMLLLTPSKKFLTLRKRTRLTEFVDFTLFLEFFPADIELLNICGENLP